ncbi:hypothetical protein SBV1_950027 [Verrucomicrobia bacterium]|nr:hypothetical protein SBV1_950027 [Verrucomicrobiota bacterium]
MEADGQKFLDELSLFPTRTFERNFCRVASRLGLGSTLSRPELHLLFATAFLATLCNIALNGLGDCPGYITPENEPIRTQLEQDFLVARDELYASRGWEVLRASQRRSVQNILLNVLVNEDNLAW